MLEISLATHTLSLETHTRIPRISCAAVYQVLAYRQPKLNPQVMETNYGAVAVLVSKHHIVQVPG